MEMNKNNSDHQHRCRSDLTDIDEQPAAPYRLLQAFLACLISPEAVNKLVYGVVESGWSWSLCPFNFPIYKFYPSPYGLLGRNKTRGRSSFLLILPGGLE